MKLLSSTFLWYCLLCCMYKVVATFEAEDETDKILSVAIQVKHISSTYMVLFFAANLDALNCM